MKEKVRSIQGLRAIAYIAIFISHSRVGSFGYLGAWGVSVFLVMSGLLMYISYHERVEMFDNYSVLDCIQFSYSKIRKLYSLHFLMMILSIPYAIVSGGGVVRPVILHTLLIQIWIPKAGYYETLNGVSWYLNVCALTYFCFPFIMKKRKRWEKKHGGFMLLIILQVAVSCLAFIFGNRDRNGIFPVQWITYYCPLTRLIDFAIGCKLGDIYLDSSVNGSKKPRIIRLYEKCPLISEIIVMALILLSFLATPISGQSLEVITANIRCCLHFPHACLS